MPENSGQTQPVPGAPELTPAQREALADLLKAYRSELWLQKVLRGLYRDQREQNPSSTLPGEAPSWEGQPEGRWPDGSWLEDVWGDNPEGWKQYDQDNPNRDAGGYLHPDQQQNTEYATPGKKNAPAAYGTGDKPTAPASAAVKAVAAMVFAQVHLSGRRTGGSLPPGSHGVVGDIEPLNPATGKPWTPDEKIEWSQGPNAEWHYENGVPVGPGVNGGPWNQHVPQAPRQYYGSADALEHAAEGPRGFAGGYNGGLVPNASGANHPPVITPTPPRSGSWVQAPAKPPTNRKTTGASAY